MEHLATPPPISMMTKWRVFAPSRLHHYFGWKGVNFIQSKIEGAGEGMMLGSSLY